MAEFQSFDFSGIRKSPITVENISDGDFELKFEVGEIAEGPEGVERMLLFGRRLSEYYRRLFESAPQMLKMLKKAADSLEGWSTHYDYAAWNSILDKREDLMEITLIRELIAEVECTK